MTLETSKIIIYISVRVLKVKCSKLFQMNKLKFKIHWVFIQQFITTKQYPIDRNF